MLQRIRFRVVVLLVVMLAVVSGCKKQQPVEVPEVPVVRADTAPPPPPPPEPQVEIKTDKFPTEKPEIKPLEPSVAEVNRSGVLKDVYFDFDRYDLNEATRRLLRGNVDWVNEHPSFDLVIEGHCDERGTIEYNLSLGEKRANSVRDYMRTLGVSSSRMRIISYGEERPAEPGHSESAWSKNRRAHFLVE